MARNKIVNGAIKAKDWFFQKTSTPTKRGSRFLTDDRPNEITFRAFFESFTNKAEVTDRAYEDISGSPLETKQGLTTLATDAQAKARIAKSDNIARAVQPSQLPEVVAGDNITVTIDPETLTRDRYIISAGEVCPCVIGIGQDVSETIPLDADIIVFYDGTSFKDSGGLTSLTDAQTRIRNWYETYRNSNNITGKLIEIQIGTDGIFNYNIIDKTNYILTHIDERFLLFPKEYINGNLNTTIQTTLPDGTVVPAGAVGVPTNNKCLFVIFEDEANAAYYSSGGASVADDAPTSTYISDYQDFVSNIYGQFSFFKGIVYPAKAAAGNDNTGNFHALLTKTMTNGLLATSPGLTAVQIAGGWASDTMDFMTTNNEFSNSNVDNLIGYGWKSTEYSFTGDGSMSTITQAQFNIHIEDALSDLISDFKTVTITPWLEYDGGIKVYGSSYSLKVGT